MMRISFNEWILKYTNNYYSYDSTKSISSEMFGLCLQMGMLDIVVCGASLNYATHNI